MTAVVPTTALPAPTSIFTTHGPAADPITALGITLTVAGSVVTAVVILLLGYALFRSRAGKSNAVARDNPPGAIRWIIIGGVAVPAVILIAAFVYSMTTQAAVAAPPTAPVTTVEVFGHRWWWELRYAGAQASDGFVTANELHIPVGRPVRLRLSSADVIHSFWVPQLAGKTDVVPGQHNEMWIQADRPGTYSGRCAEYCGLQHAQMNVSVVAETPERYAAWVAAQRRPADTPPPPQALAARGRTVFLARQCAACHAVRGTDALGVVGPDLTHLASRQTIAAGILPNTRDNLDRWVANAQAAKPGNLMPAIPLSGPDRQALLAYLETLK